MQITRHHAYLNICTWSLSVETALKVFSADLTTLGARISIWQYPALSSTCHAIYIYIYNITTVRRCIWRIYYPRPWSSEVCSRYTLSRRRGVYLTANFQWPRSRVVWFVIYATLLWFILYYSAWADYVNGSVSGIAFLNFEGASSVIVRCRCLLTGKGWVWACLGH